MYSLYRTVYITFRKSKQTIVTWTCLSGTGRREWEVLPRGLRRCEVFYVSDVLILEVCCSVYNIPTFYLYNISNTVYYQ